MLDENLLFTMRRSLRKLVDPNVFPIQIFLLSGDFMTRYFFVGYVCMVQCGRPAAFMYSYKPHTIEENVLCYATVVVTGTNLLESREILTLWYSIGEPVFTVCMYGHHI